MAQFLKQSTAATIMFGPFVDKTDGITLKTDGTTITDIDHASTGIFLSKAGAAAAIRHATVTASVADAYGMMKVTLDTTDTGTVGTLDVLFAKAATYLPVHKSFMVLPANVFDSLVGGTDLLDVSVTQLSGTAQSLTDLKDFADTGYDPATHKVQGVVLTDTTTAPAAATIAAAVWDLDATTHQTTGTFGQAIGDPASDTHTIYDAVVTAAAGVNVAADIIAVKAETASIQTDTNDIQTRLPAALTANGNMKSSLVEILTTALTETVGQLAAGFKQFFNIGSPTSTMNLITAVTTVTTTTTATNLTNLPAIPANWLTAAGVNSDVGPEIAAAVWDLDATTHQTTGTFGQAIGDPAADTHTIYDAVVTAAAGVNVAADIIAVKAETASIQTDTNDIQARLPAALTANGNMKSSLVEILTTALTESAGLLAGAFKKFFNVSTPTGTVNSIPDAVAGAAGGLMIAGTNAALTITGALVVSNGIDVSASTPNRAGLAIAGNGTAPGVYVVGGSSGDGIHATPGASGGGKSAIYAQGLGTGGNGILATGADSGSGIAALGGINGDGLKALGGSTMGRGIYAGADGGGVGIEAAGVGVDGHGISAHGSGGVSSHGAQFVSGTGLLGHGIHSVGGGTTGSGLSLQGNIGGDLLLNTPSTNLDDATLAAIAALNDFDPASDTIAHVTLVDTCTTNTDMRGTNGAASQASVDDLPTNAELATALGTADDAVIAAIGALNDFNPASDEVLANVKKINGVTITGDGSSGDKFDVV